MASPSSLFFYLFQLKSFPFKVSSSLPFPTRCYPSFPTITFYFLSNNFLSIHYPFLYLIFFIYLYSLFVLSLNLSFCSSSLIIYLGVFLFTLNTYLIYLSFSLSNSFFFSYLHIFTHTPLPSILTYQIATFSYLSFG